MLLNCYTVYIYFLLFISDSSKRSATLVTQGATHTLLQVLVYESRDANYSEELLITIHQLLSKLGPKGNSEIMKENVAQRLLYKIRKLDWNWNKGLHLTNPSTFHEFCLMLNQHFSILYCM